MDMEKLDQTLGELYSQAAALQDVVRLLRANRVHGVDLPSSLVAQLEARASLMRSRLLALSSAVDQDLGPA